MNISKLSTKFLKELSENNYLGKHDSKGKQKDYGDYVFDIEATLAKRGQAEYANKIEQQLKQFDLVAKKEKSTKATDNMHSNPILNAVTPASKPKKDRVAISIATTNKNVNLDHLNAYNEINLLKFRDIAKLEQHSKLERFFAIPLGITMALGTLIIFTRVFGL